MDISVANIVKLSLPNLGEVWWRLCYFQRIPKTWQLRVCYLLSGYRRTGHLWNENKKKLLNIVGKVSWLSYLGIHNYSRFGSIIISILAVLSIYSSNLVFCWYQQEWISILFKSNLDKLANWVVEALSNTMLLVCIPYREMGNSFRNSCVIHDI